ncbi:LEA domain protein [Aspergillus cavernicola]|uniref:LEA domain protein n=1 Tax=Aspergillus cavernicola TaxID=176166 RepID=A0ABR4IFT4_9EURO
MTEASPLPTPRLTQLAPGISLLRPLSRRGHGPGLIVIGSCSPPDDTEIENGVPSHRMKWAEEGYTVVEILTQAVSEGQEDPIGLALSSLASCDSCEPKTKVGLVVYDPTAWPRIASSLTSHSDIVGVVLYTDSSSTSVVSPPSLPSLQHIAGPAETKGIRTEQHTVYHYPSMKASLFATPFAEQFHYASEAVSHTRNLTFLKKHMEGPYFDLEAIWDEHTYYEFETRSVPDTMSTMVQEPYVNHIPTITGGIGRDRLSTFYQNHFVFQNPADTEMELISRTLGIDRVVDEFLYKFTHDMQIDWLLPGIPPTGRKVELPFTAIVNIRGDRLYHEHIAWDQTTALVQLGLMPEYLPFPYPMPDGRQPGAGKRFEYRVPGAGKETADKLRDKNSVPSNYMFSYGVREVDDA